MTDAEILALRKTLASADGGCSFCVRKIVEKWNTEKPPDAPALRVRDRPEWKYDDDDWQNVEVAP